MKKVIVFSGKCDSFLNFRKRLLQGFVANADHVTASAPDHEASEVEQLKTLGIDYQAIALERTGMNPFADLAYFLKLKKFLKTEQPDLVFSYNIKPVIYGSLAARFAGVKTIHALIPGVGYLFAPNPSFIKKILQQMVFPLYRFALKRVEVLFFQNPDDLQTFRECHLIGPNTTAVRVNGSGVDLNEFECSAPPVDPIRFLFIGRLIRDKGLIEYAAAAKALKAKYGERVEFGILGALDSNPAAITQAQLDEWVSEGYIKYHGVTKDVRPYLREMSVFVLPSFYMEGVPRTILESLSMGRPIVTCNTRGCKETVNEGENGYLIPPRDSEALTVALESFLKDPSLVETMGKASRAMAEELYDVEKVTEQMLKAMHLKAN
ncbi:MULTISPECIES: glycosyltransferase family 4 protein [unclassified Lentimonas]|uniref:glycosyltransferase family 4 protein n=1 Tax=unclassified Lentimonas TaxID=2630993 RepID=UPI001324756B|nr:MULTISPECIES: glycosyltransferase family 4 protein [unclassified Lentimonas]CAA6680031.1 Lipid carrier : UDP-N-acetylgalactosaminyltransferase (EC / Alpha-1,3-N-acetylgalactosamine transferase PglA (EC; Putative glycosyltransferase [Lentimonas sp. CC4]CAA6685150.1 Lipid carrier : UDP-N-acetylgalactosaminyltransferase (EC / Alpha-1,3-N-acetylgalactosamine transferase PglA (EC; Putative glycosyltransferase [Lentimonas sp. CC6]CAA7075123.1 Lipid carrier : UDP-N-acetylgalactosaminyltransferase (E